MGERRQVHRREPIEVELDNGQIFVAKPLPWMQRNDLGNEILRQNTEAVNEAVRLYTDPETNLVQIETKLAEKLKDPISILRMSYPENDVLDYSILEYGELTQLLLVALEVNQLDHLRGLVDPNFQPPMPIGGTPSLEEGETETGQKIGSSVDSIFSASTGQPSSSSLTEK